jgi:porin
LPFDQHALAVCHPGTWQPKRRCCAKRNSSPLVNREHHAFGVGYYYAGTSEEIGPLLAAALGSRLGDGQGVELFYNAVVNSMLTITPDLQVLSSARENLDTALVAGLRMNVAF